MEVKAHHAACSLYSQTTVKLNFYRTLDTHKGIMYNLLQSKYRNRINNRQIYHIFISTSSSATNQNIDIYSAKSYTTGKNTRTYTFNL